MAEKPILFSGAMVRAVIKGSKTQTRRVRNLDEINVNPDGWHFCGLNGLGNAVFTKDEISYVEVKNPYGDKGTRLWVRETWQKWENGGRQIAYQADLACWEVAFGESEPTGVFNDDFRLSVDPGRWKPSIHMPRWASRLTLEITQVRVERVQDISGEDAIAEGAKSMGRDPDIQLCESLRQRAISEMHAASIVVFHNIWDSINSNRGFGWEKNPWVWAISFRKVEAHAH